jgi:hypothetical protein
MRASRKAQAMVSGRCRKQSAGSLNCNASARYLSLIGGAIFNLANLLLVAALMLQVVSAAAQQAASAGGDIQIGHAVQVCVAAALTFLIMKQVPPMAAGLASGLALSSFGAVSTPKAPTWSA